MPAAASASAAIPCMPPLAPVLQQHEITQAEFARAMGLSSAAACRLVKHGLLPARRPGDVRRRALDWLKARGVPDQALKQVDPGELQPAEVALEAQQPTETPKEEPMLIPRPTLSLAAAEYFDLKLRNPFWGEVRNDDDMFTSPEIAYVTQSAWQAVIGGNMVAVVGESGAGKTTVLEALCDQIVREGKSIIIIRPSVSAMEDSNSRGALLRTADLYIAIAYALDKKARVPTNAQKRSQFVRELLEKSTERGHRHLLVLEEAHAAPGITLNQLKRLNEELRLGRQGMLGVLLLGHPELEKKLTRHDVRESMQRASIVRLRPLDAHLSAYLQRRAKAAARDIGDFITPEGIDELRTRLTVQRGPRTAPLSMLYPLNVNNWMTLCLNTAAALGAPRIDRDVVRVAQPDVMPQGV